MTKVQSSDPNVITDEIVAANGQVENILSVKKNNGTEVFSIDKDGIMSSTAKDFGAFRNAGGYSSLQAAIDSLPSAGGMVFVPIGTMVGNITVTKDCIIAGAGHGSVLKESGGSDPLIYAHDLSSFMLRDLFFDEDDMAGNVGVRVFDTQFTLVERCEFDNGAAGRPLEIRSSDYNIAAVCENVIVRGNKFTSNPRDAMYISANNVLVENNIVKDSADVAIDIGERLRNVIVRGNIIQASHGGVYIADFDERGIISNNVVEESSSIGLKIHYSGISTDWKSEHAVIANNTVKGTGSVGIEADGDYAVVNGNHVHNFGAQQLLVIGDHCSITGNSLTAPLANYSMKITGDYDTIAGNELIGQGTNGGIWVTGNYCLLANNAGRISTIFKIEGAKHSILGNTFTENASGILLDGATYCHVRGNVFIDSVYNTDIIEQNAADYNVIENNVVKNAYAITLIGSNTVCKHNRNFKTENAVLSGTFAIDSTGLKTVTVNHGLSVTPSAGLIALSVVENTAVDDWAFDLLKVSSISSSQIVAKINVTTASATGGATAKLAIRVGDL